MKNYIAYYRVSTAKQGKSGLGLAGQRESVLNFIAPDKLINEFTDIESGKNDNRPELLKAIQVCKKEDAVLVIAKLDRLSRNLTFISSLMDAKIKFVCVDMPDANEFTIHIFAALAQQERKMISERTKAGLRQARLKGKIIGSPENLTAKDRTKGNENYSQRSKDNDNNKRAFALIKALRTSNTSWANIAKELNSAGYKTAKNKDFQAVQVQRIYNKYA